MSSSRYLSVAALAGLHVVVAASAAEPSRAHDCVQVASDAQRLACYDEAFGRTPAVVESGVAAPSVPAVPGPSASVPAAVAAERERDDFGLSEQDKRARAEQRSESRPVESITATIQTVSRRPTGEQVFVMEDGQVWIELEANTRARVKDGDVVTIRRGSLGSFLLVTPKRVATHVRRLK